MGKHPFLFPKQLLFMKEEVTSRILKTVLVNREDTRYCAMKEQHNGRYY